MTTRALAKVHLPSKHGTRGVSGYLTRFHRSPGKTTGLPGTGTWAVRSFPGTHTLKRSLFGAPTASRPTTIPFSSNWSRPALNNGFVNPLKGAGSVILTRGAHQSFAQREVDDVVSFYDDKVTQTPKILLERTNRFLECKKYMNKPDIKTFLDEMIRSRIGIRLIAEQVISLREQGTKVVLDDDKEVAPSIAAISGSEASEEKEAPARDVVGVVHRELKPAELIRTCASFVQELCDVNYGSSPEVVINGQNDTTFTYVPVHLEYILCELLKNAVRATVEQSAKMGRSALNPHGDLGDSGGEDLGSQQQDQEQGQVEEHLSNTNGEKKNHVAMVKNDLDQDETRRPNEFGHPPVEVTIAQGEREITIRIRDQGGGISREDFDVIFDYSFTTVKKENESVLEESGDSQGVDSIFKGVSRLAMQAGLGGPIAGLGFGLPLTRIYAQYFGGDIHLISLQGYGCDVFLKLKQIDESLDDLQI
ncbi:hypothetical protein BG000_010315 [Podila horticola]|nr:hypothetical protein BG000_010315 [Podila horticola]